MRRNGLAVDVLVQGFLLIIFGLVILLLLAAPGFIGRHSHPWVGPRNDTKAERDAERSMDRLYGWFFACLWVFFLIMFLRDLWELLTR